MSVGGEDTLVWPIQPIGTALLRVAEMAQVTVLPFWVLVVDGLRELSDAKEGLSSQLALQKPEHSICKNRTQTPGNK